MQINGLKCTNQDIIKLITNLKENHTGIKIFENPYNPKVLKIGYDGCDTHIYTIEDINIFEEDQIHVFAAEQRIDWKVGRYW